MNFGYDSVGRVLSVDRPGSLSDSSVSYISEGVTVEGAPDFYDFYYATRGKKTVTAGRASVERFDAITSTVKTAVGPDDPEGDVGPGGVYSYAQMDACGRLRLSVNPCGEGEVNEPDGQGQFPVPNAGYARIGGSVSYFDALGRLSMSSSAQN